MKINQDVFIQQGILDCQINQLIEFSNTDPEVKKTTSDPVRFHNRQSFDQWLAKGRIIYTLIDQNKNLLGIVWFGHKDPPISLSANFTFAIRIYPPARGQGLSFDFLKTTLDDVQKNQPASKIKNIWVEVSTNNQPAIKAYKKLGLEKFSNSPNIGKIIMVLKK